MSAPSKPFAKGYGILLGILVLWAVALALFTAGVLLIGGGSEPPV
jgi:hypothetical protein